MHILYLVQLEWLSGDHLQKNKAVLSDYHRFRNLRLCKKEPEVAII